MYTSISCHMHKKVQGSQKDPLEEKTGNKDHKQVYFGKVPSALFPYYSIVS